MIPGRTDHRQAVNQIFKKDASISKATILNCSDFGKNPVVVSFIGNHVGVRRVDGSLVNSAVPSTVITLHEFASTSRWEEARKLCRVVKESSIYVWCCIVTI